MNLLYYVIIAELLLLLSYRVSLSRALTLSILISVFVVISEFKNVPYETVIFISFLNSLPLITFKFKKDFDREASIIRERLSCIKSSYEQMLTEDRNQLEKNHEIEKRLKAVLSLYEVSKDMSACLTFEDIFTAFSSFLKRSFRFSQMKLVLLKDSKDIGEVYRVGLGELPGRVSQDNFDRELIDIALKNRENLSISSDEESEFLRRLTVIKDFDTLVSVPLSFEENLAGVLYIENISKRYFENFIILAGQFLIELQKVILYKKVEASSITDSLTGVNTRRYFMDRFREEIRRSMRHKTPLALLMLDLDHFKETNDTLGHLVGDVVLKEVAGILKQNLREIDIIGRFGGEEFSIVLSGGGRSEAGQVAERLRESVQNVQFKAYDETVSTTISIGISIFPGDGVEEEGLIDSADRALYKAKEMGRNRIQGS